MSYDCKLTAVEPQPALTIRSQARLEDLPAMFENFYGALIEYLEEMAEDIAGPPFVIYHSIETEIMDVEAGLPIAKTLPEKGTIKYTEISIERAVSTIHTGPYSEIESAYLALVEWIDENGFEPTGITYEFYLNDPGTTPPEELQTEIFMPVTKGSTVDGMAKLN